MSNRDPHEYVPGEFTQFTRFQRPPSGAGPVRLQDMNGVNLLGYDIQLWDADTGGVQLVENADYSLMYIDESVTISEGFNVYGGYQILNAAYQDVNLYITVKIVGGYTYRPYRPLIVQQISTDTLISPTSTEDAVILSTPGGATITATLPNGSKINEQISVISSGPGSTRLEGPVAQNTNLSNAAQTLIWDGSVWVSLGGTTGAGIEPGEVLFWAAGSGFPAAKLPCDGALYQISDYPSLFNAIGITWGGDGITTFAVPDIPAVGEYVGGIWVIQAFDSVTEIPADPAMIKDYVLKQDFATPTNDVPFIWEGGVFFIGVSYLYNGTPQRSNGLIAIFDDGIDRYFAFSADFSGQDSTIGVTYNGTAKTISCVAVGPDYTSFGVIAIYRFENVSTAELAQPKDGWELKFRDWTNTAAVPNMWGDGQYKATLRQGTGNAITTSEVYIDRINTNLTVFSGTVAMPQYLSGVSFSSVSGDFTTVSDTGVAYIAEIYKFTGMVQVIHSPAVESGSNSNGEYIRFADGTQICWKIQNVGPPSIPYATPLYHTQSYTWTFPKTFTALPVTSGCESSGIGLSWMALGTSSTSPTATSIVLISAFSGITADLTASMMAVGRWK